MRLLSLLLVLLLPAACGQPAADAELVDASGVQAPFRYADYRGQYLLINYWAEWCGPCRAEIPELNEVAESDSVTVLGVNFDGLIGDELKTLMTEMNVGFPTVLDDPAPRFGLRTPSVLPTTLVIGPTGELQEALVGPQTVASLTAALLPRQR